MKSIKPILFLLTGVLLAGKSFAQTQEQINAWQAYMTPGENHAILARDAGTWKTEMTTYMEPNSPPIKSVGTAEITMILGGRYQHSVYKGDMMGMPFEGISVVGYDNTKKIFATSWIDNAGTGLMIMEGKWDTPGKVITYIGTTVDPVSGKDMKVRQVLHLESEKSQYMEMYMTENGKERKSMELRMTKM